MTDKKEQAFIRHPDFRTFYAIGAVGTWTAHDFRLNFFSEKIDDAEGEALVNDVQVILPPKAVRELAVALARYIKEFEKTHGVSLKGIDIGTASELQKDLGRGELKKAAETELILGPDFKKDLKQDLEKDLRQDLKKDLEKGLKQDLKKDLKHDLEKGLRQGLKKDLEKDIKQDLKKDLKQDLEKGLKKDIKTEVKGAMKDTKLKEEKKSKSRLPRRGRRRVKK
jgi:hypothetical protein